MAESAADRLRAELAKRGAAPLPPAPKAQSPAGATAAERLAAQLDAGTAPGPPKRKRPGLLRQATNLAGQLPRGAVNLVADTGKEALNTAKQAANLLHVADFDSVRPRQGESAADFYTRTHPLTGGLAESAVRTGGRVTQGVASLAPGGLKPSETDYAVAAREGRIVATLLEDVGNVAAVGRLASKAATAAAARTGGAAATTLAKVAEVAEAPSNAGRAARQAALAPLKRTASAAYQATSTGEGRIGQAIRFAHLDPNARLLRREAIDPATEKVSAGVGEAVRRGEAVAKVLPDLDEQRAMTLVGEGEAPALARLRAHLAPEAFDAHLQRTYGESLPRRAADLAADVAEGKAPELAARIDEGLRLGRELEGGRADRSAAYLAAKPSRGPQAGFEPLPAVVDQRLKPLLATRKRIDTLAAGTRAQADRAAGELARVQGRLSDAAAARGERLAEREASTLGRATIRQEARAAAAVDRLTAAQDLAVAARVPKPRAALTPVPTPVSPVMRAAGRAERAVGAAGEAFDSGLATTTAKRAAAEQAMQGVSGVVDKSVERALATGSRTGVRVGRAEGIEIGRSQAEAALAGRLARLESRRLTSLRARAERAGTGPAAAANTAREGTSLGRAQMRSRVTENVARSAEGRQVTLAGHLEAARRDAEYSLAAAPARLRPVLKTNREAASLLTQQENRLRGEGLEEAAKAVGRAADELPVTLARLKESGADFDHFTHIRLDAKPTTAGAAAGALPKIRKGREERVRTGSSAYDRTVRAQAQAEIDSVKIAVAREAVEKIRTLPFVRRFESIEAAAKEGYVAWDPASPFEKAGQITSNTTFVPAKLHEQFRSYFVDPAWDKLLKRTYDPAIQAFKVTVLPLSPSWQVGNVVGNALMAMVGGGVGPVDFARQLTRTVKAYRASGVRGERSFEAVGPRRLYTAGPTHEEFSFLRPPDERVLGDSTAARAVRAVARPGSAVVRKSYALNGFVDDLGRSAVYLSRIEKGASPEAALKSALRAMGDFSRMTPFERRTARRIVPFYAWQRHLTQLAFRLPVEHPLRTAWTLHLADQWGSDESLEDLPEFLAGAVPLPGGRLLGTRGLNPFSQVGGAVLKPSDALNSLSPAIKIPYESYTGINTFTGRPFTRPPGTGRLDELNREMPTAPSVLKRITDVSPQKRLLESLQGRGRVVRYDTGDQRLTEAGPIQTEKTPAQGLARFLGFPLTTRAEAERIAAASAERAVKAARLRESYERRNKAASSSR